MSKPAPDAVLVGATPAILPGATPRGDEDRWREARNKMSALEAAAGNMPSSLFLGAGGIFLAASLFLVAATLLGASLSDLRENTLQFQNKEAELLKAVSLQEALFDAVAAVRSYAVEPNPQHLLVAEDARRAVNDQMRELGLFAASDPGAQREIQALAPLVTQRLNLLYQEMPGARKDKTAARMQRRDTKAVMLTRRIDTQLAAFRARISAALADQQRNADRNAILGIGLAMLTAVAAPVCGVLGWFFLRRERDSYRANELQMQLMHVQRVAVMGETSSVLAHEITQPLAAAANYLSVIRKLAAAEPAAQNKIVGLAEKASQQIQRAAGIVQRLRNFIRKRAVERSAERPGVLIEDAVALLGASESAVKFETHVAGNLLLVMVDRVQIQQVLVNLMRNAVEAMQHSAKHKLCLSAAAFDDDMVRFSVADSGFGLSADIADRLFCPFVTTKPDGMGVGLSICRSIITHHQGRIWAEPNPAGGTIFHFTLPIRQGTTAA